MSANTRAGRILSWWPAGVVACVAASAAVGVTLRLAVERPSAAWVVPWLWLWGLLALGTVWAMERAGASSRLGVATVVAVAVMLRLPLVGVPALLSDDVYRYLWEGAVLNRGLNPFVLAPDAIRGLDDALRARVNHPSIPSIYPPVALLWFRAIAALGLGELGPQVFAIVFDSVACIAMFRYRSSTGGSVWPALLYALHPLPAVEGVAGMHLETPAVALALVGLAAGERASLLASFASGISAGVKLVPLVWWWRTLRGRAGWIGAFAAGMAWAVGAAAVMSGGSALLTAWRSYLSRWSFNGFLYPWLQWGLGDASRAICAGLGIVGLIWSLRARDPVQSWFRIGTTFVLVSPTVHPWYLLWVFAPSLMLGRLEWPVACVLLHGSYLVLSTLQPDGRWHEGMWLWFATWGMAVTAVAAVRWSARPRAAMGDGQGVG
jgi:hypothetical protein